MLVLPLSIRVSYNLLHIEHFDSVVAVRVEVIGFMWLYFEVQINEISKQYIL